MQALWGQCLQQVQERNADPHQIAAALPRMHLELVLTAHPTEAKRTIVLEHHRNLYLLLVKRENQMWTPYEQRAIRDEIKTVLSLLWRTGEIFLQKPDVAAGASIMHYLCAVFRRCCVLDRRLRERGVRGVRCRHAPRAAESAALQQARGLAATPDGHPFVTAVTRQTLEDLRLHSCSSSASAGRANPAVEARRMQQPPAVLRDRVRIWPPGSAARTPGVQSGRTRPGGSWCLMLARLPWRVSSEGGRLLRPGPVSRGRQLLGDLQLLRSLIAVGASRLADGRWGR
jgi:phosphoenolpyruvate carboxylase